MLSCDRLLLSSEGLVVGSETGELGRDARNHRVERLRARRRPVLRQRCTGRKKCLRHKSSSASLLVESHPDDLVCVECLATGGASDPLEPRSDPAHEASYADEGIQLRLELSNPLARSGELARKGDGAVPSCLEVVEIRVQLRVGRGELGLQTLDGLL